MKVLNVEATIENLAKVFVFLQESLEKADVPPKVKRQIKLCVEELYMNITHYAYNPNTGPASIAVDVVNDREPTRIVISFTDEGIPYDPLAKEDPDLELGLDERPVGGLGIYLVKNTMDKIEYERKDDRNILTIEKDFASGPA